MKAEPKKHYSYGNFFPEDPFKTICGLHVSLLNIESNLEKVTCGRCIRIEMERQEKFNESLYSQGH